MIQIGHNLITRTVLRLFILFLLDFMSRPVKAQFPNPMDFNTATNATNTGTIPVGATDLHWTAVLTNSLGTYVPAVSCGNIAPGNWVTSPFVNTNWITYPHGCSANPAEHSCLGSIDEFYKLTFTLPGNNCGQAVTTASAYCLSLDFFADNWVNAIYVNGILAFNNPTANPYGSWGFTNSGKVTAVMCNNWQVGVNNVIVHVKSGAPTFPGYSGFLAQANQTVNTTVGVPFSANTTQTNVSCFGGSNGSASVSASGGTSGYSYTWQPSGGNSSSATGLTAGVYTVIVASGNCSTTKTITINQPPPFSITSTPNTTICNGSTAVLSASGAVSYTWNTGSNGSSININNSGTYIVTGANSSGCTSSNTITVAPGQSPALTTGGSSSICIGSTATLTANGATSYTWNTGAQTNSIITSPTASIVYTVSGSSSGMSCIGTQTIGVTVNSFLTLGIAGSSFVCTGSQGLLVTNGADTYTWNTGSQSATLNINPTTNTSYSVAGTNTLTGCTGSIALTVTVNPLPQITVNNSSICPGQTTIVAASGAGTYTWSNGSLTASATVNSAGVYTVSGASSGCINTQTVNVNQLSALVININGTTSVCLGENALITANGAGTYTWNTGVISNSLNISEIISNSTYSVTGTDNSTGCINTQTFNIAVNPLPSVVISGNNVTCDDAFTTLSASGADTYLWNSGATVSNITVNPSINTTYTVVGTNSLTGCENSAVITVSTGATPNISVTGGTICAGVPFTLVAEGASSYLWSIGAITNTVIVSPIVNAIYSVVGYGTPTVCNTTKTVEVTVKAAPQLTLSTNYIVLCKGTSTFVSVTGANTYLWSDGQSSPTILITPLASTIYSVISLETASGCISSKSVQVVVNELPAIKIIGNQSLCDGEKTTLKAIGANFYQWSTGTTEEQIEVIINENDLYFLYGLNTETGCANMDSIRLGNSAACCEIYIPNSFTPNEDGHNEAFGPVTLCKFQEYELLIYDKWGEQIFTSNDINLKWNGYYKGVLCKQDVYVYLLRAKRNGQGVKPYYERTGHVSIIR